MSCNEWQKVRLGEVSKGGRGYYGIGASAVPYSSDKYTYLRITDINDDGTLNKSDLKSVDAEDASNYLLEPNDIVFARTGNSTGRNYFYDGRDGKFVYAGFLIKFSIDETKINPKFVKYFLQSQEYKDWVSSFNTGSTRGNINAQTYASLEIPLLPEGLQERISGILGALDDKIECNNRINRNLEEQAQALFRRWFVDFEFPDPNNAGKPYRSSGGSFIDSPLGKIPQGWTVGTFGEIAELIAGGDKPNVVSEIQTSECNVPIFSNGISNEGLYGYTTIARIYNESVTISARGTIGYVCLRQNPYLPIVRLISATPNKNIISAKYLFLWLRTANINGTGTTQQQLTVPDFKKTIILIPNFEIICNFTNVVDFLYNHIETSKVQNQNLAKLRDTLLPKLMNGEI